MELTYIFTGKIPDITDHTRWALWPSERKWELETLVAALKDTLIACSIRGQERSTYIFTPYNESGNWMYLCIYPSAWDRTNAPALQHLAVLLNRAQLEELQWQPWRLNPCLPKTFDPPLCEDGSDPFHGRVCWRGAREQILKLNAPAEKWAPATPLCADPDLLRHVKNDLHTGKSLFVRKGDVSELIVLGLFAAVASANQIGIAIDLDCQQNLPNFLAKRLRLVRLSSDQAAVPYGNWAPLAGVERTANMNASLSSPDERTSSATDTTDADQPLSDSVGSFAAESANVQRTPLSPGEAPVKEQLPTPIATSVPFGETTNSISGESSTLTKELPVRSRASSVPDDKSLLKVPLESVPITSGALFIQPWVAYGCLALMLGGLVGTVYFAYSAQVAMNESHAWREAADDTVETPEKLRQYVERTKIDRQDAANLAGGKGADLAASRNWVDAARLLLETKTEPSPENLSAAALELKKRLVVADLSIKKLRDTLNVKDAVSPDAESILARDIDSLLFSLKTLPEASKRANERAREAEKRENQIVELKKNREALEKGNKALEEKVNLVGKANEKLSDDLELEKKESNRLIVALKGEMELRKVMVDRSIIKYVSQTVEVEEKGITWLKCALSAGMPGRTSSKYTIWAQTESDRAILKRISDDLNRVSTLK